MRTLTSNARLTFVVAAVALAGVFVFESSRGAFSDTTDNSGNSWDAGSVVVSDDDSGAAMFAASDMVPGDSVQRCITVSYTGSVDADLRLYGAVTDNGLAPYLDLTVDTGTVTGSFPNCTGWSTGTADVYDDTLANFSAHTGFANGLDHGTVSTNDTVTYRFTVTLQDDNAAQAQDATTTFTWEAQNT